MHRTVNSVLILWYHVSGGVILPCDHLKNVSSIVFMTQLFICLLYTSDAADE